MYLVMLMAVPVLIGIVGLFWTKSRITWKEFLVLEGAAFVVLGIGYLIARHVSMSDVEIWSGRVVDKKKELVSCSHSYPCNCRSESCGKDCTTTVCDTCYEHFNDWDWAIYTSNGERIEIERVDRQGVYQPKRWTDAYANETTAVAHAYENYIKANPDSILRRQGATESFKNLVPPYPNAVYDYYRVNRFISVGLSTPDAQTWNWLLNEMNADLGAKKKVNVIVVVVKAANPSYEYALEESWMGGKKNDLVVLIGAPEYPKISWARIMSWTRAEDLKVELRDAIQDIGTLDRRDDIARAIRTAVDQKFIHRHMNDFKYLAAGLQPGTTGTIILFVLGIAVSVGLWVYFYYKDPFGDEY